MVKLYGILTQRTVSNRQQLAWSGRNARSSGSILLLEVRARKKWNKSGRQLVIVIWCVSFTNERCLRLDGEVRSSTEMTASTSIWNLQISDFPLSGQHRLQA
jgi:hypothetical protein